MLIVEIYVNDTLIIRETAIRIKGDTNPKTLNTYRLGDGFIMRHRYGNGASKLAQKMLKRIKQ